MARRSRTEAAGFRLILGGAGSPQGPVAFCGHCGSHVDLPHRSDLARMCERCSIGVVLETHAAAAPNDEPFLIVDPTLEIVAISDLAEEVLGIFEQDARGRRVTDFLVGRDQHGLRNDNFAVAIADSFGSEQIQLATARLRSQRSVELTLRIAACTPPRAALVVFAGSRGPRLHLALADHDAIA